MSKIIPNFQKNYRRKKYQWQFTLGALIVAIVLCLILAYSTPFPLYLNWLIAISAITLIYFGWDKSKARRNSDVRIPEIVLHILNLAGGFLGGFLGMQLFRHKTDLSKHFIFPIIIVIAAVLHAILFWLMTF